MLQLGRFNFGLGSQGGALAPFVATRRRLVIVNLLVVSTILLLMALAVYIFDAHALDQQIQQQLTSWASRESPHSLSDNDTTDGGLNDASEQYEPSSPNVFALMLDTQQHIHYDPGNAAAFGLPDRTSTAAVLKSQTALLTTYSQGSRQFRLYTTPIRQNGQVIGVLQVGISLTTRNQQLRALLETLGLVGIAMLLLAGFASLILADRALGPARLAYDRQRQFAAAASHELRTPLALVGSQADLIARLARRTPTLANSGIGDEVEEIQTEVAYMARLVRDLLLLARDPHDSRVLIHHTVDVAELATAVTTKLTPLAAAQDLTLNMTQAATIPAIVAGDPDRLRQVIVILLENAIRYTPAGGTVAVTIRGTPGPRLLGHYGGHVVLTVRDTGVGIAKEEQARIFEPFYRGDTARTNSDRANGAGLGLAIAHWIVDAHGGTITVDSTLGTGSTFVVTLPLATTNATEGDDSA